MKDNLYKIIISHKTADMLVSHSRFIANISEKAAIDFVDEFYEKVKSLERFPERNPLIIDPTIAEGKYRKLVLSKRYLLVYQIKGDFVYIDALLDCRQDYNWLL